MRKMNKLVWVVGVVLLLCVSLVAGSSMQVKKQVDKVSSGDVSSKSSVLWLESGNDIYNANSGIVNISNGLYVFGGNGDVYVNGALSGIDALYVKLYLVGAINLSAEQYANADFLGNGKVDGLNAELIQRVVVGQFSLSRAKQLGRQIYDGAMSTSFDGNVSINKLKVGVLMASDGSVGVNASGNSCVITGIKNGLIVNATCS